MERTLSRNEAKVVLDLEWRECETVTLAEIRAALDASEGYARKFAHGLVRKGWFERLRPGLFQFVPAARGREGAPDSNPLAVGAALAGPWPWFYSFGTACTHHGLTEQVFSEAYLACPARRRPAVARETRYVFVHVPRRLFFGFEEVVVLGRRAPMASAERALLDALDRPAYAGGIGEVSGMIARAGKKLSWSALAGLARRWGSSALARRLGYFLDLHRVDGADGARAELLRTARPASRILLGPRRKWGVRGALVRPWNVVANVPLDVLASAEDRPRRRVLLPRIRR